MALTVVYRVEVNDRFGCSVERRTFTSAELAALDAYLRRWLAKGCDTNLYVELTE